MNLPVPRLVEASVAAAIVSIVVLLIAWRIGGDMVLLPAAAFLFVFLATLWRNRTSTINHQSNRPRVRSRSRS